MRRLSSDVFSLSHSYVEALLDVRFLLTNIYWISGGFLVRSVYVGMIDLRYCCYTVQAAMAGTFWSKRLQVIVHVRFLSAFCSVVFRGRFSKLNAN